MTEKSDFEQLVELIRENGIRTDTPLWSYGTDTDIAQANIEALAKAGVTAAQAGKNYREWIGGGTCRKKGPLYK